MDAQNSNLIVHKTFDDWYREWKPRTPHDINPANPNDDETHSIYYWMGLPVSFYINKLHMSYLTNYDLNFRNKVIDMLIHVLYKGDWFAKLITINVLFDIAPFDPDYIHYLNTIDDAHNFVGYKNVKTFAKVILEKLHYYGEINPHETTFTQVAKKFVFIPTKREPTELDRWFDEEDIPVKKGFKKKTLFSRKPKQLTLF